MQLKPSLKTHVDIFMGYAYGGCVPSCVEECIIRDNETLPGASQMKSLKNRKNDPGGGEDGIFARRVGGWSHWRDVWVRNWITRGFISNRKSLHFFFSDE